MKRKGMTLVELLAVIVVLAIVSLIAVPTVLNIISRVRLNALKDSAYGLVEAGTLYNAQYQNTKNVRFEIEDTIVSSNDTEDLLEFKGKVKEGTVIVDKKGKTTVCITDGTNSAYKNYDETKVTLVKSQTCTIPENTTIVWLENDGATRDELSNPQLTDLLYELQEKVRILEEEKSSKEELNDVARIAQANQEAIENMPTSEVLDGLASKVKNLEENITTKSYVDDNINTLRSEMPSTDNLATKTELNTVSTIANSKASLKDVYPVGSIFITTTNTNPGTYISGTTWASFGSGRTLVGVNSSDDDFATVEKTGGEKTHTLTVDEMPRHFHGELYEASTKQKMTITSGTGSTKVSLTSSGGASGGHSIYTSYTGGSQSHNNLQPYITVYMWKRTA